MSNTLILNKPFVSTGLTAVTLTIPSTGLYSVKVQVFVPQSVDVGSGSGTGQDGGLGMKGGFPGDGVNAQLGTGQGHTGLGCSGTNTDGAVVPPVASVVITSGISIIVAQNGSTKYTSTAFTPSQSEQKFKVDLSCTAADVILITPSSSTATDNTLNGLKFIYTVQEGY